MRDALYDTVWGPAAVGLAVGCLLLVAAVVALSRPRGAWLRDRLGAYDAALPEAGDRPARKQARLDSLYGATERRLDGTSLWRWLERRCERAGSHSTPAEVLLFSAGAGLGLAVLATALGAGGLLALAALAVGACVIPVHLGLRGKRRLRRFEEQLPDTLQTMAGSLKVGHSFNQGVQAIVDKGAPPASEEFERLLAESQLGRPMDEALAAMAARVGSSDLEFVLMSVRIQRRVGGSLAGLFETVAETVRERQQFRRKVRALTATARSSAWLLTCLPIVTGLLITAVNPTYLAPLFTTGGGLAVVAVCLVTMTIGGFVLQRIADVKG
jgi:tight adherence protein B